VVSGQLRSAERAALARRASLWTICINLAITVARAMAGYLAGSTAVMADAANSATDIFASLVVLGGSQIAARPPDPEHQFGHEKAEAVAAKVVGLFVTATGFLTGLGAIRDLHPLRVEAIGQAAVWVSIFSIVIKEVLYRFLTSIAGRTGNQAIRADAKNQRVDVFASTAALIGALGGRLGYPVLDPLMAIVVSVIILRMGISLYVGSIQVLMDPAPPTAVMTEIRHVIRQTDGVRAVDSVRARQIGDSIYVDCKIQVDGSLTVEEGHQIAGHVRRLLREQVDGVRDVLVHVNPCRPRAHGAGPG
jgi:cation diffusion facilitator family transporter